MDRRGIRRPVLAWALMGLAWALAVAAQEAPTAAAAIAAPEEELDAAVVVGERPGPALWKVSFKGHVLWILPTLAPLPQQVVWRSQQVEAVIAESQAVYTEAGVNLQLAGNGDAATEARLLEALGNPDHRWLREVMPADLYARFDALNQRYAGGDGRLELFRPFYAALELRKRALVQLQLTSDGRVHDTVGALARRRLIDIIPLDQVLRPRAADFIRKLQRVPAEVDNECARWQLLQLERELREAVARANAWSVGDMAALQRDWEAGRRQEQQASCTQLFQAIAPTERAIRDSRQRSFTALQKALKKNRSTLALVLVEDVFDPQGAVALLRKAGFTVEEPRAAPASRR